MEVKWKKGSQFKSNVTAVHERIEKIRKRNEGRVTAEDVVQAAKAKSSPLHIDYEWDDTIAAHRHRLETARVMMRSVVVVRDDIKTDRPQRVYEIVREPESEENGSLTRKRSVYRTVDEIMADPEMRAELIDRALSELISFRRRYRNIQEIAIVLRAIDEMVETIKLA